MPYIEFYIRSLRHPRTTVQGSLLPDGQLSVLSLDYLFKCSVEQQKSPACSLAGGKHLFLLGNRKRKLCQVSDRSRGAFSHSFLVMPEGLPRPKRAAPNLTSPRQPMLISHRAAETASFHTVVFPGTGDYQHFMDEKTKAQSD